MNEKQDGPFTKAASVAQVIQVAMALILCIGGGILYEEVRIQHLEWQVGQYSNNADFQKHTEERLALVEFQNQESIADRIDLHKSESEHATSIIALQTAITDRLTRIESRLGIVR